MVESDYISTMACSDFMTMPDMNDTIAHCHTPNGLTEVSFSLLQNVAQGHDTLPYDPAIPADCRTYGFSASEYRYLLTDTEKSNSSYMTNYVGWSAGYPYNPVPALPQQLLECDSEWKKCFAWHTAGDGFFALACKFDLIPKVFASS